MCYKICVTMSIFCSVSNDVRINRREPSKFGNASPRPLAVRVWLTPGNTSLPARVTLQNLVVLGQTVRALLRIRLKYLTLASRLSMSLKVIGNYQDRSDTWDFLLMFRSNHGSISYRFRDNWRFRSKIRKFFPTRVFSAPFQNATNLQQSCAK